MIEIDEVRIVRPMRSVIEQNNSLGNLVEMLKYLRPKDKSLTFCMMKNHYSSFGNESFMVMRFGYFTPEQEEMAQEFDDLYSGEYDRIPLS